MIRPLRRTADCQITRSRAPLRLGLAGGGTDLSPYCDEFGGSVLNVAISRYAYATIETREDRSVEFVANDLQRREAIEAGTALSLDDGLRLHRAVYSRVRAAVDGDMPPGLRLTTSVECPMGSGLGASSALTVAMLGAFRLWLGLPLGEFDLAHLAYEIERIDLGMAGGRQDQYAATFGGVNFMEFAANDRVIVNPLHLDDAVTNELEASIMLCFTGQSRLSSDIIRQQVAAVSSSESRSIDAMHRLKRSALEMKAALLRGEIDSVAAIVRESWEAKRATARDISTLEADRLYEAAVEAGARAGKISGAGGGGFLMLIVDPLARESVIERLSGLGAQVSPCRFEQRGVTAWRAPAVHS
jgi:D-glycero-alpha-D-manno-heptose-7-phosphate kinase